MKQVTSIVNSGEYLHWDEEKMTPFSKILYQQRVKFLYEDENATYHILDNFNIVKNLYRDKNGSTGSKEETFLNTWKMHSPIITTEMMADMIFDFYLLDTYEITEDPLDFIPFSELAEFIRQKIDTVSDTYIGRLLNYIKLPNLDKKVNGKTIKVRTGIRKIKST